MKKILALILVSVMLFSVVSCGSVYSKYDKYITVGDLKNVSIDEAKILKKLDEQIETLREKGRLDLWVDLDAKEAVAKNGDKLNIDFDIDPDSVRKPGTDNYTISDETKANMKSEGYSLVLGSNSFIGAYEKEGKPELTNKGFEEQLIGAKVNTNETDDKTKDDKVDVTVTFPDDYKTTELQGVIVTFKVTVNSISRSAAALSNKDLIVSLSYTFVDPDAKADDEEGSEGGDASAAAESDNTTEEEDTVTFENIFKNGKFDIDFSSEEFGKFSTIFDIKTVYEALEGKTLYEEFEIKFTVPSKEDMEKDEKQTSFIPYAGREIAVKFTVNKITTLPDWNDEYVKKQTSSQYETVKAYEDGLYDEIAFDLAYTAIVDSAVLKEVPSKEVKKLYKSLVQNYINNILNEEFGSSNSNYSVGDFTQKEYDSIITDEIYAAAYEYAAEQALLAVKEQFVCEYLYEVLGISVSNKEYKEKIDSAYTPYKDAYKGLGINTKADYVTYMYGDKDSAITAFKYQKLSEMQKDLVALITVNPAK